MGSKSMKQNYIYITSKEWFEETPLKNPVLSLDHNLEQIYPQFYNIEYDLKILATKPATAEKKEFPGYNDYREKYGKSDISAIDIAVSSNTSKNVFLNGFNQKQFEYIAPLIKETTEILYLFKCHKINDLSLLSTFKNLRCVHIYWNNSLDNLWDMKDNSALMALSFVYVTKLSNVEALANSHIEYINLDSSDNSGKKKKLDVDKSVFEKMKTLKHLFLTI